jgi:hypothetical protein
MTCPSTSPREDSVLMVGSYITELM